MTARLVLLLLAVWLALRLAGHWRRLRARPRGGPMVEAARKCPGCGAYVVGTSPCGRPDCALR